MPTPAPPAFLALIAAQTTAQTAADTSMETVAAAAQTAAPADEQATVATDVGVATPETPSTAMTEHRTRLSPAAVAQAASPPHAAPAPQHMQAQAEPGDALLAASSAKPLSSSGDFSFFLPAHQV